MYFTAAYVTLCVLLLLLLLLLANLIVYSCYRWVACILVCNNINQPANQHWNTRSHRCDGAPRYGFIIQFIVFVYGWNNSYLNNTQSIHRVYSVCYCWNEVPFFVSFNFVVYMWRSANRFFLWTSVHAHCCKSEKKIRISSNKNNKKKFLIKRILKIKTKTRKLISFELYFYWVCLVWNNCAKKEFVKKKT